MHTLGCASVRMVACFKMLFVRRITVSPKPNYRDYSKIYTNLNPWNHLVPMVPFPLRNRHVQCD